MSTANAGIRIAFGQNAFSTTPTWTRLDYGPSYVSAFTIDRGRTYEQDKTQAGTATITLIDTTGMFDPTNGNSPLYGQIGPMCQARIGVINPVNNQNYDLFTGYIESWNYTIDTAEKMMTITIDLVDAFDALTRAELPPDSTGTTILASTFPDTTNLRILAVLDYFRWDGSTYGGWPASLLNVNTGNTSVQQTIYNPQTSLLSAIQDAADSEFPGVANVFMNKTGQISFYGRYPRFDPSSYPQDVNFWTVGDRNAVNTFGGAPISNIEWNLDQTQLINACSAYPQGIAQSDIAGQLVTNPASISQYGNRVLSIPDLQTGPSNSSATPPSLTANQECYLYSYYYVANYSSPVERISTLEFDTQDFHTASGQAWWNFICGVEIGDLLTIYTSNPGGGGFGKETDGMQVSQFFVEGIHYTGEPMKAKHGQITMSLDVSPRAWFTTFPTVWPIPGALPGPPPTT